MNRLQKILTLIRHPRDWRAAVVTRTVPAYEHLAILSHFHPDTIIDVGANKGQFSLAVRAALPQARIFAFEPLPGEADIYERNLGADPLCRLFRTGLSHEAAKVDFHVADRADSSSLLRPAAGQLAAYKVARAETISIDVSRLDAVLSAGDLVGRVMLKIDVQGAEDLVLRGAERLLPHITWVYVEASFVELYEHQPLIGALIALLAGYGFQLRGMANVSDTRAFGPTQVDVLVAREPAAA